MHTLTHSCPFLKLLWPMVHRKDSCSAASSLVIIVEEDLQFFANVKERLLKNLPKNNTHLATPT